MRKPISNVNDIIYILDSEYNKVAEYEYDSFGNIVCKLTKPINDFNVLSIDRYEYDNFNWQDQLTKFNNDIIEYDEIGNPLMIGSKRLMWINGRQLSSYQDGETIVTYKYDKDGIRMKKRINNIDVMYHLEGDNIIYESTGERFIYYLYDNDGDLEGIKYNNTNYYYVKNIQNDIVGILDNSYNMVAKYEYDSFGNILTIKDINDGEITDSDHIAHINPFRYRSYYYDKETGFYYLNNRYYNPVWGRFVNADNYISTGQGLLGYNMYVYSNNNFPNVNDYNGSFGLFSAISKAAKKVKKAVKTVVKNAIKKIAKKVAKKINNKIKKRIKPIQEREINKACQTIKNNQKKKASFDATKKLNKTMKTNAKAVKKEVGKKKLKVFKYATFANLVRTGGVYDIKRNEEWDDKIVSYNGMILEDQDVGNIHYGYIGRAAGFSKTELLFGAGAAQLKDNPDLNFCLVSACDDPRDTYFVQLGISIYDAEHSD